MMDQTILIKMTQSKIIFYNVFGELNEFFTEFIILAGIIGAILAFLIIKRWRDE